MQNTKEPSRKSIKLTRDECRALRAFRKGFATDVECAEALEIDRVTLLRVITVGSGSQVTVEKIREKLLKQAA